VNRCREQGVQQEELEEKTDVRVAADEREDQKKSEDKDGELQKAPGPWPGDEIPLHAGPSEVVGQ